MRYTVLIEPGEVEPVWTATVPALPGCVSQGDTFESALANIREAIEGHVAALIDIGRPVPDGAVVAAVEVDVPVAGAAD